MKKPESHSTDMRQKPQIVETESIRHTETETIVTQEKHDSQYSIFNSTGQGIQSKSDEAPKESTVRTVSDAEIIKSNIRTPGKMGISNHRRSHDQNKKTDKTRYEPPSHQRPSEKVPHISKETDSKGNMTQQPKEATTVKPSSESQINMPKPDGNKDDVDRQG